MTLRTFSYGGGVQSTAALVLAAEGRIDFPIFLFANVGEDSENPKTLAYVRDVATPYAEARGVAVHELRATRFGEVESLREQVLNPALRGDLIPFHFGGGGGMARRACTNQFKIKVIARWQRQYGATKGDRAVCGLGISLDEMHRARSASGIKTQTLEYPLIDMRLTRQDCVKIIEGAGLPVPPKSSCYFCPFHSNANWRALLKDEPELFEQAVQFERDLNAKRATFGKDQVYLHGSARPLDVAIQDGGQQAFDLDSLGVCESGYCMT